MTNNCCGCGLCQTVCPVNAIETTTDELGTTIYIINEIKCIGCEKCKKCCPLQTPKFQSQSSTFFIARSTDETALMYSSSGGVAYQVAKAFLVGGGLVFGAAFDVTTQSVRHIRIETTQDLLRISGSKYVQSDISACFEEIRSSCRDKKILFIGCPCQVAAIKNYCDCGNLYTIDLICHGTPNMNMLNKHLTNITDTRIENLSFRKGSQYVVSLTSKDTTYCASCLRDVYYASFINFISLNEYCYYCAFAKPERVGDITVGDYYPKGDVDRYSAVVVNSSKGDILFKSFDFEYKSMPIAELIKDNWAFREPSAPNGGTKKRLKFRELYAQYGLKRAYYSVYPEQLIKNLIKAVVQPKDKLKVRHK